MENLLELKVLNNKQLIFKFENITIQFLKYYDGEDGYNSWYIEYKYYKNSKLKDNNIGIGLTITEFIDLIKVLKIENEFQTFLEQQLLEYL